MWYAHLALCQALEASMTSQSSTTNEEENSKYDSKAPTQLNEQFQISVAQRWVGLSLSLICSEGQPFQKWAKTDSWKLSYWWRATEYRTMRILTSFSNDNEEQPQERKLKDQHSGHSIVKFPPKKQQKSMIGFSCPLAAPKRWVRSLQEGLSNHWHLQLCPFAMN